MVRIRRGGAVSTYDPGDLVANNASAGSVAALDFRINDSGATTDQVGLLLNVALVFGYGAAGNFRIHFWSATSTGGVTNGDGGAFLPTSATNYRGFVDVALEVPFSGAYYGLGSPDQSHPIYLPVVTSGTAAVALVESLGTYAMSAAASRSIVVTIQVDIS